MSFHVVMLHDDITTKFAYVMMQSHYPHDHDRQPQNHQMLKTVNYDCICEILACLIALTTISHSLEGFLGYEYLLWSAFHFCMELALETWAKATLNNSLGVHDLDDTLTTLSHQ